MIVSCTNFVPMKAWADILDEEFSEKGFDIPVDLVESNIEPKGKHATIDDSRMRNVLGITPTPLKNTILDMAYSFIQNGIVKPRI